MKTTAIVVIVGIAAAVIYGVLFSFAYPLVRVDGGLVSLFAIAGLVTALALVGFYEWSKRPLAAHQKPKRSPRPKGRKKRL